MGEACGTYGGKAEVHTGFWWGYLKGKRPFGRPRRRWKDKIRTDFNKKSIGSGLDLSGLRKRRVAI